MQLASHGVRAIPGRVSQRLGHNPPIGGSSRLIHTGPSSRPTATAQKLFNQSKSIFSRFLAHLATPGHIGSQTVGRPLHNASSLVNSGRASIQAGYSLPVRHAMARPLPFSAYHLPKPPVVQRSLFQVGLGTARNFHSARPIFANLVENVPVAGRALSEADWDLKMKEEQKVKLSKKGSSKKQKSKQMMKPNASEKKIVDDQAAEFDHYFAAPSVPETITYLLIPLAPTPTSRTALPASQSPSLLPISVLLDIHSSHELHSLRVSSLFARLDASQIWTHPGVSCSVYGDPSGLASILKVEFSGWTETEVRAVIGEAGTGWCVLEQVYPSPPSSPSSSEISMPVNEFEDEFSSQPDMDSNPDVDIDPADSLILPSLDLSNHQVWTESLSSVPSPLVLPTIQESHSVFDYDSDDVFDRMSDSGSEGSWMALEISSRVSEVDANEEPKEYVF